MPHTELCLEPKCKSTVNGACALPRQARLKGGATSMTGHKLQSLTETRVHLHSNAERAAEGHRRQHGEHQFCAAGRVEREASAGGKTR